VFGTALMLICFRPQQPAQALQRVPHCNSTFLFLQAVTPSPSLL
jgi:hypothetical protein